MFKIFNDNSKAAEEIQQLFLLNQANSNLVDYPKICNFSLFA
jgi:hypothetical protein